MTLELAGKPLAIQAEDRLSFCWMLECLLEGRPSFRSLKANWEGELVYLFTRHQSYLQQRWPCLYVMAKGWERPIVISDKREWFYCLKSLERLETRKGL